MGKHEFLATIVHLIVLISIKLLFFYDKIAVFSRFIAFLIHKRYITDPEQFNQQRFNCAAQMREPLYLELIY
ncbi:MAG: hypothetical protein EWV55_05195 [Microcystis viridis Mv_BB_P_19951000_S69]|uniref:Uncharacterized protein n=1 Tax=Microcystis viridis Mv_BB_P_19951000_S68D TaxID=2486270 RepID=A0A552I351_MICVR|nr:MAG: hypothetical protein EWV47_19990 [Microcystis viridis Mv_BB_P_19951000_S68]TRU77312.1 MAG: hypothetical protein EWV55_05195 [Microcystis viridis Mv_BB_P_19951000_S69]TRU77922.1 MAG: hypothetical protein EWV77_05035 [Microcystis viridis Mv_BB_P_19951000_S68D]TRU91020.1 MAG: hypothetical protein EWV46_00380 [Microcystis viridis Mv_BB_P_19951000_S69D]